MQKYALYFAAIYFAAAAIVNVIRLITDIEITVGTAAVPMWGSLAGAVVAALLAAWMFMAARRSPAP